MDSPTTITESEVTRRPTSFDRHSCTGTSADSGLPTLLSHIPTLWITDAGMTSPTGPVSPLTPRTNNHSRSGTEVHNWVGSMSLADFVQQKFIPEFVERKRSAGRAHFHDLLKFIVFTDNGDRALADARDRKVTKRDAIATWPYIGSLRLCDICEETVQLVTSTALATGYSIQTVTHIRNMIRTIYSYATKAYGYTGTNPAALVPLPTVVHRNKHVLTLTELREVMTLMRSPESVIALFALLTDMNLVEISGLQWLCVNLSGNTKLVGDEWIPAKTIAVRNQWYRGEFRPVSISRKRFVPVPDLLCSILRNLRCRKQFTKPSDFVLASHSGSPVYPGNIAKRRLKSVGQSCDMPWLSWNVFSRTHFRLKSEHGRHLYKEYAKVLPSHLW